MRPIKLCGEKRDASAALLGLGWDPEKIARVLGVSRATIYRHQKSMICGITADTARVGRLRRRIEAEIG